MRVADLQRLYDFSYWANGKLFDVIVQLSDGQFTQTVGGSYGSIRNALVHVLSAEWGWLDRCGGEPRGPRLDPNDYPTARSLIDTWKRVEGYVRLFLSTLKDEDLERKIEFSLGGGPTQRLPLGDLMHHAVIHAVHHRGQVALMLRELGLTPGNFDLLIYGMEDGRS